MNSEIETLLQELGRVDRHAATWCACQCARTVLRYVPKRDKGPRQMIEIAEAWVRGEVTWLQCLTAAVGARTAAAFAAQTPHIGSHAASAALTAAEAVADTAADPDTRHEVRERHLAMLLDLVSSIRWPLVEPDVTAVLAAPEAIAVAWDWLGQREGEQSIPELLSAHSRAERLGLDWSDPVQRAIAERAVDEARVRELLEARGGGLTRL